MIDLSTIPEAEKIAKGEYSIIRAAHEDGKKSMQVWCGQLAAQAAQILKRVQPDNDAVPDDVDSLIVGAKNTLLAIEACAKELESLAKQRAELKKQAWQ